MIFFSPKLSTQGAAPEAVAEPRTFEIKILIVILWLVMAVILIGAAFIANSQNWSEGATILLEILAALIGPGGLGVLIGEGNGVKAATQP